MLPIIGAAVIGGMAGVLIASFIEDTAKERERYNRAVVEYEQNIQLLRRDIAAAKEAARRSIFSDGFKTLVGYHRASVQCANKSYKVKQYINNIIKETYDQINKVKRDMDNLYAKTKNKDIPYSERQECYNTLSQLKIVKSYMYDRQNEQIKEREKLLEKVRAFNNETHDLKLFIRDNCGNGGRVWYDRLEERTAARNAQKQKESAGIINRFMNIFN